MKILHIFTLFSTAHSFFDGQFEYLSDHGYNLHLICSAAKQQNDFILRNKLKYNPVEISRSVSPIADIKAIWKICRYINKEEIDVVIGHTPKGALLGMIASFIMRVPRRVYYRHGLIFTTATGLKRLILKKEEQFVSMLANRIINVSPSLGKLAVDEHLNGAFKQQEIGSGTCGGIDATHKFNPNKLDSSLLKKIRTQQGLESNDFVIGFCGRLCKDKGVVELIEGYRLFQSNHPELSVKLLLLGGFDERDILPSDIKKEITNNRKIIFTDYITENIEYYYQLMDIFVFPSYREGFGMSVLEASSMEKPILVSKSHGCVDSIRNGVTGYYITLSSRGIADGLDRILDPNHRQQMGNSGRKFVLQNFDYQVMWPQVLAFYQSL